MAGASVTLSTCVRAARQGPAGHRGSSDREAASSRPPRPRDSVKEMKGRLAGRGSGDGAVRQFRPITATRPWSTSAGGSPGEAEGRRASRFAPSALRGPGLGPARPMPALHNTLLRPASPCSAIGRPRPRLSLSLSSHLFVLFPLCKFTINENVPSRPRPF